jgi:ABC-2 type transport system ATP-binding protein
VGLAQALIHNPSVLILDEPTSGLDPNQIVEIRNLIAEAGKEKTVMLSTHIMQEVEAICDRVIIIDNGQIVADNSTPGIYAQTGDVQTFQVEFKEDAGESFLKQIPGVSKVLKIEGNHWLIESSALTDIRETLFNQAVQKGFTILMLQKKEKKLEEVFRELTGKN